MSEAWYGESGKNETWCPYCQYSRINTEEEPEKIVCPGCGEIGTRMSKGQVYHWPNGVSTVNFGYSKGKLLRSHWSKLWRARCLKCGKYQSLPQKQKDKAEANLKEKYWEQVDGDWYCPECKHGIRTE